MEAKEFVKPVILLFLFFFAAPALGLLIRRRRGWQRGVFAAMCFMTISGFLGPAEWGFTLAFDEWYRGHARGFQFFFNEVLALGLIISIALQRNGARLMPPGLWLYLAYVFLSLASIFNAPEPVYSWMSAFKAFKVILIFLAAYNFLRSEDDLRFFLAVMSVTIIWQLIVVLKMKYLDGVYQVSGTFEHQNSLSMYATLLGMVLLAAGAGPKHRFSNLCLFGFVACAVIVQSALSRAGLVVFAIGTVTVVALSLLDRISSRRVLVAGALTAVALVGLSMTLDTIIGRFKDAHNLDSNQTRKMLNKASREMFGDYPLGVGWNNYAVTINHPYRYGEIIDEWFLSHGERIDIYEAKGIEESHYYLLLAETGLQGLASYLLLIGVFLWWNLRSAFVFRHRFLGALSMGIAVGCGANYLHSILERVLTQPRNMMLWMIVLAVTARIEVLRREIARERRLARRAAARRVSPVPALADERLVRRSAFRL